MEKQQKILYGQVMKVSQDLFGFVYDEVIGQYFLSTGDPVVHPVQGQGHGALHEHVQHDGLRPGQP